MEKPLIDYYDDESVDVIHNFCSYKALRSKGTYENAFRRAAEAFSKKSIKAFTYEDYQKLKKIIDPSYSKQIFEFLYAFDILENNNKFSEFGDKKKIITKLEKHKREIGQPKVKMKYKPAISLDDLEKILNYIDQIPENEEQTLKYAFCFYLLFFEKVPVNDILDLSYSDYKDDSLFIERTQSKIVVPKRYRFIWENVENELVFSGFSSMHDSIQMICERAKIKYITPKKIREANNQRFFQCPDCGEKFFATTKNWVGINSYIVCKNCSTKYIGDEKKKIINNFSNYNVLFGEHSGIDEKKYKHEDDINGVDVDEFNSFEPKEPDDPKDPKTRQTVIERLVRETKISKDLKEKYRYKCQMCGGSLRSNRNDFISEGHHIQPYNNFYKGNDSISNMIVLCPNHHAQFDRLYYAIEPGTHRIKCLFEEDEFNDHEMFFLSEHILDKKSIDFVWGLFLEKKNKITKN